MDVLFNQATVGLAECSLDGHLLRVNDYFCAMLGRSHDELVGRHLREIVHADDLPRSEALPVTYIIDDKGKVREQLMGEQTLEGLQAKIKALKGA